MLPHLPISADQAQRDTVTWLERAVIGLNLCPFAKAVHVKGQIRYVVYPQSDPQGLLDRLVVELKHLQASEPAALDTVL